MVKDVIVVGAGPGGLASAMLLSSQGFQVTVVEKQSFLGGRTSELTLGEYKFDRGPTFLMMPQVLEAIFKGANRNLRDYLQLQELEPLYTLKFGDVEFSVTRDQEKMFQEIERLFPGNGEGYLRFMEQEGKKFDKVLKLLQQPFSNMVDLLSLDLLRALPKLDIFETVYGRLSHYFSDERLKWSFSFQAKYLGMSAWECPATFTILSYIEHKYGLYHPIGGVNKVCEAMAKVIEEYGGKILLNTDVKKVVVENKKAVGVLLEDQNILRADDVIINADFGVAATRLFDQTALKKYKKEKIEKKKVSCSTFMMYLGINKPLELPHHLILFAEDYPKNVREMTKEGKLSEDASIYVHNPSAIDPTLAPTGKSSLYVLMPCPNAEADIDWDTQQIMMKEQIISRLEKEPALSDIRNHIEAELVITPRDWQTKYEVYKGATFNLAHSLDQMMYFRPHNKFEDVEHCFLVGGGTHPGSGLPTIFQSAIISSQLLMEQYQHVPKQASASRSMEGEYPVWR